MKVAIFGGTGFVGGYIIDELLKKGHSPVILDRPGKERMENRFEKCTRITGSIEDEDAIRKTLEDAAAAIYNIGILREFPSEGITFQALQFEGAKRVIDLAVSAGVPRFLLMSANGVHENGTAYQKTKYMAEQHLRLSALDWTIFRPSVIFGDPQGRMEFATQLYRDIIRSPMPAPLFYEGLFPVNAGSLEMSPIYAGDVARIFVDSLDRTDTYGQTFSLGGPEKLSWKSILDTIAQATGRRLLAVPAPAWGIKTLAAVLDRFPLFPITRDQITMLMEGNTCDSSAVFELFGIEPTPFNTGTLAYLNAEAARRT